MLCLNSSSSGIIILCELAVVSPLACFFSGRTYEDEPGDIYDDYGVEEDTDDGGSQMSQLDRRADEIVVPPTLEEIGQDIVEIVSNAVDVSSDDGYYGIQLFETTRRAVTHLLDSM